MIRGAVIALVTLLVAGPATAGPFDGVFASQAEGCGWMAQDGVEALFEHDFLAMSLAEGINANEFHCEFVDRKTTSDGSAVVVTAFCEYPGEPYPDLLSLREFDEHSIAVTSMRDAASDLAAGAEGWQGTKIFTRCDNLKELPH